METDIHDQIDPIPSLPSYPSLSAENIETEHEKLSPVSNEAGDELPRSPAPPTSSETIRAEAAMNDQKREEPIIHRVSNASTVHNLLRAGRKFQARTKPSVRFPYRLQKFSSGMASYVKPISHNNDIQVLPLDYQTHYSIGINLPSIQNFFSPSFQSLYI